MPRWVALLRAVNVGGRVVKMDQLRELFADMGFTRVSTYIASGNVIFDADSADAAALERAIEARLRDALGYEVETFIRSAAELAAIAEADPFDGAAAGRTVYVTFLREPPPASWVERLMSFRSPSDDFRVVGRESWWAVAGSMSDSRYGKARPDATVVATARNMTTVRKLAALAAG